MAPRAGVLAGVPHHSDGVVYTEKRDLMWGFDKLKYIIFTATQLKKHMKYLLECGIIVVDGGKNMKLYKHNDGFNKKCRGSLCVRLTKLRLLTFTVIR